METLAPIDIEWNSADAAGVRRSQDFAIPGLAGMRPLSLWLPPGPVPEGGWPLAFFFDGQNIFGDEGTFAGGWRMHQALAARQRQGLSVPAVVGLYHGSQRESELSPWPPFEGQPGHGQLLWDWIAASLLPALYAELPLNSDPAQTLVGGSSLGGLMALYGLFSRPEHFGKALVMSPALWPDRFAIFQALMQHQPHEAARVYLDHGMREVLEAGKEHLGQILFEQTQLLADLLEVMGFTPEQRLRWRPDPEGEHNERHWARRLPQAFDFLYGSTP